MNFRDPGVILRTFVVFTAIGVFFALHQHLDDVLYNPGMRINERFLFELSGAWSAMLMLPFLNAVTMRNPLRRSALRWTIPAILGAYVVYTVGHTTLNDLLRFGLAPLFGVHGITPFGFFRDMPSEAANDTVFYGMLLATLYLTNHFIEAQELTKKLAETKLENLRLQLNPHFLFNALNAISAVMYEDVAKADRMLAQLSDFLRMVLASSSAQEVSLAHELEAARAYVEIMRTRLERRLELELRVSEDAAHTSVPFMLLQPLLENSIRHGMRHESDALHLVVGVRRADENTVIDVEDDGIGIADEFHTGIGLKNVAARLGLLYGSDGARFRIARRDEGGTRATIVLPFAPEASA